MSQSSHCVDQSTLQPNSEFTVHCTKTRQPVNGNVWKIDPCILQHDILWLRSFWQETVPLAKGKNNRWRLGFSVVFSVMSMVWNCYRFKLNRVSNNAGIQDFFKWKVNIIQNSEKILLKCPFNVAGVQGSTAGAALPGTLHPLPPAHHGLAQGTEL